jgi:hypothetical protein
MDYRKLLSEAYQNRDKSELENILKRINEDRSTLDKWFDLFIEKFDERMNKETRTSLLWRKYHEKFDLYSDLNIQKTTAEFYIKNV